MAQAALQYQNSIRYCRNSSNNQKLTNNVPLQSLNYSNTPFRPTPIRYSNQALYFGLTENQNFYSSTPLKEKDVEKTPNLLSLFSRAIINQNKPITALYTNARVGNIDIKLILDSGSAGSIITKQFMNQLGHQTSIEKIDNFPFEINGIQISTKVLIIETTQYQVLIENDWLVKANAILNWNIQELQITFNRQYAQVLATCRHFKTQGSEQPLIEFKDTLSLPTLKAYQVSWADNF
ncbi:hypothetical protein G9A89_004336 [Geosiphon pyriformis]|nr:hypothetical protein G9A89_004336 [Geosiphon pyriformis]